jgi:hypothetical protein
VLSNPASCARRTARSAAAAGVAAADAGERAVAETLHADADPVDAERLERAEEAGGDGRGGSAQRSTPRWRRRGAARSRTLSALSTRRPPEEPGFLRRSRRSAAAGGGLRMIGEEARELLAGSVRKSDVSCGETITE